MTSSTTTVALPAGTLSVHFIDVGQGDSILIQAPDGKTMLIDGGEADSGALQYLQSRGIKKLDVMVATHPHADHIGGLPTILKAIPTAKVVTNGQAHTTRTYERLLDAIATAKAEYVEVKRGDTLRLGDLAFAVLNSITTTGDDLNNNSVVLRLVYGQVSFLFTGDAEKEAEDSMSMSSFSPVQATILKVGHHGSRTASSPAFLAMVQPEVAIYSAGKDNSYGHPHAEVVDALTAMGAAVYGTDEYGTLVVTTDGTTYNVETETGQARAPPPTPAGSTPPADASTLPLEIVSVTSPVAPGSQATLVVRTAPGAVCNITVRYASGPSRASGLEEK
ncbi:MAG: ComEC/Rec2 family competence protein, partial [Dehalococcoidia bacterium]|nr:ComEC/Rec2 family competence protein [Dehalococcoidia bacterium]